MTWKDNLPNNGSDQHAEITSGESGRHNPVRIREVARSIAAALYQQGIGTFVVEAAEETAFKT